MYFFGQTQTRTSVSAADMEAQNTTDPARLAQLCQAGSALACKYANMPQPTAQEKAQLAANREQQAEADRAAIAQRLIDAGISPKIAGAVKAKKEVIYVPAKSKNAWAYWAAGAVVVGAALLSVMLPK